jgi:hypothetical protein
MLYHVCFAGKLGVGLGENFHGRKQGRIGDIGGCRCGQLRDLVVCDVYFGCL